MSDLRSIERAAVDLRLELPQLVDAAEDVTRYLLSARPERLRHSQAVAARVHLGPDYPSP